ncbi:MAG: GntR family transcriptional regulator [Streptosporangiaceae bacterium]
MPDPLYRQIAEDLRRQIEADELPPGAQLRTEQELQDKYRASRNTVRDAIKLLITRGLVETRPGQGTFVVQSIVPFITNLTDDPRSASGGEGDTYTQEVTAKLRHPHSDLPQVGVQNADSAMASELRLDEGATVVSRHQQRFIDGTPWCLQTSFYPMHLVEKGATRLLQAEDIADGTVAYLRKSLRIEQTSYRDILEVRAPDANESRFFRLPDDGRVSVIETRRTAFDESGSPIRVTVSVYPADRNQFAIEVGQVPPPTPQGPAEASPEPADA